MGTEIVERENRVAEYGGPMSVENVKDRTVAAATAAAVTEAQGALIVARQFPRNENNIFQNVLASCTRPKFCEGVRYRFPRGGKDVTGPSIKLAREMARLWGNIQYGVEVITDNEKTRKIRGWAWDLETNARVVAEDEFAKLIQRKGKGWIPADERDLRELTNRKGSLLLRNCLLQLMPPDLIDDALEAAERTLISGIRKAPDEARKKVCAAFGDIGIKAAELEKWAGVPVAQFTAETISNLREIYASIRDGNSKWTDYVEKEVSPKTTSVKEMVKEDGEIIEQPDADTPTPPREGFELNGGKS